MHENLLPLSKNKYSFDHTLAYSDFFRKAEKLNDYEDAIMTY